MANQTDLTLIEQQVMLAVLWQNPNAYGVSIRDAIQSRTGRDLSFGSIYAVLERLEGKGFISQREGEASAKRGGRKKLYFTITASGKSVLSACLQAMDNMRSGLDIGGALV